MPLPKGFTLESPTPDAPKLPAGFTLENPGSLSAPTQQFGSPDASQILKQNAGFDPNAPLPSATSRAASGAWQGVKDAVGGLFNTVGALSSPANMVTSLTNSAVDTGLTLKDAQRANHIGDVNRRNLDLFKAIPVVGGAAQELGKSMAAGDYAGAITRDVTANASPAVAGALSSAALKVASKVAKPLAENVANVALGTAKDEYGGNPGMAAVQNGITGWTPRQILNKANEAASKVAGEHQNILANYNGPDIDISNSVAQPFDAARAAKTNPVTGAVNPAQITKLNKAQTQLTHVPDLFSGQPTTALRPLNSISPSDANTLKSNLYGMVDYDSSKSSLTNDALKRVAYGVKRNIQSAVPESVPSGENLHNLQTLKGEMKGAGDAIPTSKSGLIRNVVRKAGTTSAAGLFKAGDIASQAGNALSRIPLSARIAAQVVPFVRRDQFGNPIGDPVSSFWVTPAKK